MRYVMKPKFFSAGDDFVVKDDSGRKRYVIDRKAFTAGQKLSFQDLNGRELAFIRQKLTSPRAFEIWYADELHAVVRPDGVASSRCRFTVDAPGPDDLEASGDFARHEY